ncbi:hypothetical protein M0805_001240 [Coniferiporia weirii]|nr:hypothetical protein M0805_001240 [Coniferiporia weirii]
MLGCFLLLFHMILNHKFAAYETLNIVKETWNEDGWTKHIHPEGQLYFRHADSTANEFKYVTEIYLIDNINRRKAAELLPFFENSANNSQISPGAEFFFDFDENDETFTYYGVDHERQCLFWLQEFDASWISEIVGGVDSETALECYFRSEYWAHIEQFPHKQVLPEGFLDNLYGILLFGSLDTLTSLTSTAPYSPEDMRELSELLNKFRDLNSSLPTEERVTYKGDTSTSYSEARLMRILDFERFINFHGQNGARLSISQSVHGTVTAQQSWLAFVASILLFRAPNWHLKRLEETWIDRLIKRTQWMRLLAVLQDEWEQCVLYSTVVLASNIAFLAIPDISNSPSSHVAVEQAATLLSIIASLGSMIIGLFLMRQHRVRSGEADHAGNEVAIFLSRDTDKKRRLIILATAYGMPYGMLMWALICFLVAVAAVCFQIEGTAQTTLFAIAWSCIALLVSLRMVTGGWGIDLSSLWSWIVASFLNLFTRRDTSSVNPGMTDKAVYRTKTSIKTLP